MTSDSPEPASTRPEIRPWKYLWNVYSKAPKVLKLENILVRRIGYSPMIFLWAKTSGGRRRPALILETIGIRSGKIRSAVLPYWQSDGSIVILGTNNAQHGPQWVRNIEADPRCWVRIKRKRIALVGHIADQDERDRLAESGVSHAWLANYEYKANAFGRQVPFVVLQSIDDASTHAATSS